MEYENNLAGVLYEIFLLIFAILCEGCSVLLIFSKCDRCSEKRVTAVAISNDGLYVCFADKFGVVWVIDLHELDGNQSVVGKKAVPLLSHYCSIITSLVN